MKKERFSWKFYRFYAEKIYPGLKRAVDFVLKYTGIKYLLGRFARLPIKARKAITGYLYILPWLVGSRAFRHQADHQGARMALADFAGSKAIVDGDTARTVFIIDGFSLAQFKQFLKRTPTMSRRSFRIWVTRF